MFCDALQSSLGQLYTCTEMDRYIRIRTPFLYPDGDVIDVYQSRTAEGIACSPFKRHTTRRWTAAIAPPNRPIGLAVLAWRPVPPSRLSPAGSNASPASRLPPISRLRKPALTSAPPVSPMFSARKALNNYECRYLSDERQSFVLHSAHRGPDFG